MATEIAQIAPRDYPLPLYRMDTGAYHRLVETGAFEGAEVELLDGLLVNKWPHRKDAIHRLDVGTYERMVATGVLEGERIELLDGLLVEMRPQSPGHAEAIRRLTAHLSGARAVLGVQLPLETGWGGLPEADLALTKGQPPVGRHPRAALLAVEVAVSSHTQDREIKREMYAAAPVEIYWLVDVPAKKVEVYTDPGPGGYGRCGIYGPGDTVPSSSEGVPDLDVTALFAGLGD